MRLARIISSFVVIAVTAACGGSGVQPPASPTKAKRERITSSDVTSASLLPRCKGEPGECLPPSQWVNKLCSGVHPEVALHMFRGGSPWKRLYSRAQAPAYNGAGGPSVSDEQVEMGEELIALRRNSDGRSSAAGEMSVGDTAGYDLLRWNGSCVTLHDGEFSEDAPRRREHARVEWRWLGDEVRVALRNNGLVQRAYVARRKECKGVTFGRVTKKCVEREDSFVAAIVDYVRSGGPLPAPSERL